MEYVTLKQREELLGGAEGDLRKGDGRNEDGRCGR